MGPGISSNYDKVTYIFSSGCWKVHSAISRINNQRVCLWKIDSELLSELIPDPSLQNPCLQGYLNGLKIVQKVIHPRILKILQIQDSVSNLAFSSEPVSSCLTTLIGSMDVTDCSYISYQILDGLSFIHNGAKMLHMGLTPSAIYLNETLGVKIFNFDWSIQMSSQGPTQLPFPLFKIDPTMPDINYTAPEVVINKEGYPQSDVFSFCCILYEMLTSSKLRKIKYMNEFDSTVDPSIYALKVSEQFSIIMGQCFNASPLQRPSVENLISQEPFQTIPIKVLRYLDLIIAKDPKDKFGFFKGLATAIHNFSPMMTKAKILPILIAECKSDPRFAPVLLGTIFSVSEKFSVSEFTEEVFKKISFLTAVKDPPHISIALLQSIPLILAKTEKSLHNDCVYPIIFQAIQSDNEQVQKECLKRLPEIVKSINETSVRTVLIPKLVDLANSTTDDQITSQTFKSIAACMSVADNDAFLREQFPRVFKSWKKHSGSPSVSEAMYEIIASLKKASNKNIMARAVQVAATVAASPNCELYVQKRICAWMANAITMYKSASSLDRPIDKPTDAELEALKPKPVQPAPPTPPRQPISNPNQISQTNQMSSNNSLDAAFASDVKMTSPLASPSQNNSFNLNSAPSFNSSFNMTNQSQQSNLSNDFNSFSPFGSPTTYQNQNQQNQSPQRIPRTVNGGLTLGPLQPQQQNKSSNNDDLLNLF